MCSSDLLADTPSQRVQFILGTEDDDEEHIPHDLFTELDELSFREGHVYEWKETARSDGLPCLVQPAPPHTACPASHSLPRLAQPALPYRGAHTHMYVSVCLYMHTHTHMHKQ